MMTLDAGGTSFRFCAMCGGKPATETFVLPSNGDNLPRCLANLVEGFRRVQALCPTPPVALSFAFPGPADYPNGIIGDLPNLPGFKGGVALGPMLADTFGLPVFINNDGDLFAYGEAIAGLLPWANAQLAAAGSPKRFRNLFGITLGTGFGGGLVRDGKLFIGDNSGAGEVWLLRNKLAPAMNAEEGASIRAVRRNWRRGGRTKSSQAGKKCSRPALPSRQAPLSVPKCSGRSCAVLNWRQIHSSMAGRRGSMRSQASDSRPNAGR